MATMTSLSRLYSVSCVQFTVGKLFRPSTIMRGMSTTEIDRPLGPNDVVTPQIRNRNPMNLEKMRIGHKPSGFDTERRKRSYWNRLDLSISSKHTIATVTHWTGRPVCSASTHEWAIQKFLYNYTDVAAVRIVGQVIGQRCLETGITEVFLQISEEDLKKERMRMFLDAIKDTGLALEEGKQFKQNFPHHNLEFSRFQTRIKPWEIVDE